MLPDLTEVLLTKIRSHAMNYIHERKQTNTNLSLDGKLYRAGDFIGRRKQNIRAEGPTVVVFADDEPLANFGHPCRYLLYNSETGDFLREVPARFPPNLVNSATRLTSFFAPVRFHEASPYWYRPIPYLCPRIIPEGTRYAILYSGLTQARHLNDMEFAYRTLINTYGFNAANIYVLNYDGTLNVFDTLPANWPGNNTPYTIKVTGQGTRAAFQAAFASLAAKLQPQDLLFIHTNNHGDNDNDGNGSFLCGFLHGGDSSPNTDGDFTYYYATEFAADLSVLPSYRALVVMMEQCCAGGFNYPILASSTVQNTNISAAATAYTLSYASNDGNWDVFAYQWIAAMNGSYPNGSALVTNPDVNHDGVVDGQEAYDYATANDVPDVPQLNFSTNGAGLSLAQPYVFSWVWCWLLWPILEPVYRQAYPPVTFPPQPNPPDPGPYFPLINKVLPEVQKVLMGSIDSEMRELREKVRRQVAPIFEAALRG